MLQEYPITVTVGGVKATELGYGSGYRLSGGRFSGWRLVRPANDPYHRVISPRGRVRVIRESGWREAIAATA